MQQHQQQLPVIDEFDYGQQMPHETDVASVREISRVNAITGYANHPNDIETPIPDDEEDEVLANQAKELDETTFDEYKKISQGDIIFNKIQGKLIGQQTAPEVDSDDEFEKKVIKRRDKDEVDDLPEEFEEDEGEEDESGLLYIVVHHFSLFHRRRR
jgi:hypothetical protein